MSTEKVGARAESWRSVGEFRFFLTPLERKQRCVCVCVSGGGACGRGHRWERDATYPAPLSRHNARGLGEGEGASGTAAPRGGRKKKEKKRGGAPAGSDGRRRRAALLNVCVFAPTPPGRGGRARPAFLTHPAHGCEARLGDRDGPGYTQPSKPTPRRPPPKRKARWRTPRAGRQPARVWGTHTHPPPTPHCTRAPLLLPRTPTPTFPLSLSIIHSPAGQQTEVLPHGGCQGVYVCHTTVTEGL